MPELLALLIVMTVGIDEPRRERKPSRVDDVLIVECFEVAHFDNAITIETYGTGECLVAITVVNPGVHD